MRYQIRVKINFRYGHRLLPPYTGHCNNVHGEGGTAIVYFESDSLDENGMVFDFGVVKKQIKNWIDENWDHTYLHHKDDVVGPMLEKLNMNTFDMGDMNPTAENMAKFLFRVIQQNFTDKVKKVGIVESFENSIAYYEEDVK